MTQLPTYLVHDSTPLDNIYRVALAVSRSRECFRLVLERVVVMPFRIEITDLAESELKAIRAFDECLALCNRTHV
jgi:hypothetical protein